MVGAKHRNINRNDITVRCTLIDKGDIVAIKITGTLYPPA
jgi:hydrogenase maturation factor HypF (carbamoyltransferase family)